MNDEPSCASVKRAGGSNSSDASLTLPRCLGLQDALHPGRFGAGCRRVHPVHDLLEGFSVGIDGGLIEEDVLGLLDGGSQHELRAVRTDEFRSLVNQCPVLRAGAQVDVDLGDSGLRLHIPAMDYCVVIVNTKTRQGLSERMLEPVKSRGYPIRKI